MEQQEKYSFSTFYQLSDKEKKAVLNKYKFTGRDVVKVIDNKISTPEQPKPSDKSSGKKYIFISFLAGVIIGVAVFSIPQLIKNINTNNTTTTSSVAEITSSEPSNTKSTPNIVSSGKCGDNVSYTLDDIGLLTISGIGDMYNYNYNYNYDYDDNFLSYLDHHPWESYSVSSVVIENGVTSIGDRAFYDCPSLTDITIPDSVTSIGDCAFANCSSLLSITIPDSVTSIGDSAFCQCSDLTDITIPDSVTSIGDSAFCQCSDLTDITIPDSVTSIGDSTFRGCSSLTDITIPNNVTSIGNGAFANCSSLWSITIPDSVTSIGRGAFYESPNLTIHCKIGSYAETYSKEHNIPFVAE